MALDATSEEFIQLLKDARDSVSHAAATAADATATAADVVAAADSMQAAIDKAAEALASANASEASHQASLALYTSLTAVQTEVANTQLKVWEAQAEKMTAESFASEAEDVFVKTYTSDGDGTFTATPTTKYSALHWQQKASTYTPTAGTYTPTITGFINVTSAWAYECTYLRVGSIVHVSGKMAITPTAAQSLTRVQISVPIPTTFLAEVTYPGGGVMFVTSITSVIKGDIITSGSGTKVDAVQADYVAEATGEQGLFFNFSYEVI